MHPAFLYLPGARLTLPELSAARIDGLLVEVGEGYIPADLIDGTDVRAASVAPLIPPHTAAAGPTAAWIHGAGDRPPSRHHVRRAVDRRLRLGPDNRLVFHDVAVPPTDLTHIGDIAVTSPVRTLVDLATGLHRDPSAGRWLRLLAAASSRDAIDSALARTTAMTRVPGARRAEIALQRLREGADQEDVTRYTS